MSEMTDSEGSDGETMETETISGEMPNGEITDGETPETETMSGEMPNGEMPEMGSMPGDMSRDGMEEAENEETAAEIDTRVTLSELSTETWIWLGASAAALLAGLLFAFFYRRR